MFRLMMKTILLKLIRLMWYFSIRMFRKLKPLQVILGFIVVPHCLFIFYHYYPREKILYEDLNRLIEDQLRRNLVSRKGAGCVIPVIEVFSHDAVNTLKLDYRPKIECPGLDWVECYNKECFVKQVKGSVVCKYSDIIYVHDDHHYVDSKSVEVNGYGKYTLNESDHVTVSCVAWEKTIFGLPIRTSWEGVKSGLRPVKVTPPVGRQNQYNVMIVVFDSTSKYDFIRFMPKSYNYLTDEMHAVFLNSYSSVGPTTFTNMFVVLTGKAATELPETRKSVTNQYINHKDFIFYQAQQVGYRTAYFDEYPGTFDKYNTGFGQQPADHVLTSFLREAELRKSRKAKEFEYKCVGDTPLYRKMFNLTKDFQNLDDKKVSVTHTLLAHNIKNYMSNAEDDMIDLLSSLKEKLEDTLVIIMGDHGVSHGEFRNTPQGAVEARLPLMAIVLPEKLKINRPEALNALKKNSEVLTTHFDLHATLMDVLELPYTNRYIVPGSTLPRSISLLREIPKSRTCSDAGIIPHICVCTEWFYVPDSDPYYRQVVSLLSDFIRDMTSEMGSICATRDMVSVEWVRRRRNIESPMDDGLKQYLGNPILHRPATVYFQAKIIMSPANAIYEGTVIYDIPQNYFNISEDYVARTNTYGDESACIARSHPHLKPFCYCTSETVSANYGASGQFEQYTPKYSPSHDM